MRYTLDNNGFIKTVAWGCMTGNCAEYTGEVPAGYASLPEWADKACINAYYLDENRNLVLDPQRQDYLQTMYEQQAIDYAPVLHKDLFETNEVIDAQYKKNTVSGKIIEITDARNIAPMLKISGLTGNSLSVFAQTKNMLRLDAESQEVNGLVFTRKDENITITGTSTAPVEYILADGGTEPLFALLAGQDYYLNVGGLPCELLYFNGETTEQIYTGRGGVINLSESKRVTQVKLKFGTSHSLEVVLTPRLNVGTQAIAYEECQTKVYNMELPDYEEGASIIIGEGLAVLYDSGKTTVVGRSNIGLLNGYNMIYTSQGNDLELTYTTNEFLIDDMAFLQGTATTTGKFKILADGSIVATNGQFSGKIVCTELIVASGATVKGLKVGENVEMEPGGVITWQDLPEDVASIYDVPDDASITTITQNAIKTGDIIIGGFIYDSTLIGKQIILGVNGSGNLQVGTPNGAATYKNLNLYAGPDGEILFIPDASGTGKTDMLRVATDIVDVGAPLLSAFELWATDVECDSLTAGGRIDCSNIGTSSEHPTVVHCNNVAVHTNTKISNNNAGFNATYGYIQEYSGSSEKFKHDIRNMPDDFKKKIEGLYDVEVKCWKYNKDYLDKEDELYGVETFGLIAEDLNEVLPEAITHKADGSISNYRDRNLINALLVLVQDQKKEIEALKEAINEIKNTIGGTA